MRAKSRSLQRRSMFGALTAMFACAVLFVAGSASAAEVPDANCAGDPAGSSNNLHRVGQTFTAQNTGWLTSATYSGIFRLSNADAFSMQIRPVDGSGKPLEDAASAIG